ncbi:Tripartite motif-containing protein 60 [Heterocephalus glaber]|uniref:Tripartite motif-containing protein 60 n=1 Tax=Heterocephalus glaber TaxID=10181 RepID=G5AKN1_HETGA|nr:Tripartite motif-containing protein 60 [Heterocephalus glaber]
MELAAALADLQTEASCPICLGYLKNPVTIYCGHNFCLPCISESWKDLKVSFPCPSCHYLCPHRKFQNNFQLGNLTEVAKLLPLRRSKRKREEGNVMCEKHKQVLTVFCQKDLEVLCPQCSFSADHQQHYVWPIEKATVYHRKQLEQHSELWKERVEQIEKVITMQAGKSVELKKKVEHRKEEIKSEFEQFMLFLQNEQETILRQLQDEEREISAKVNENLADISEHASALKYLLKEIESKHIKSEVELLTSIKSIYHRYKSLKCQKKKAFVNQDVLLDPETAHRKLTISEDKKTVRYGNMQKLPHSPKKFYIWPAVLGAKGYSSGRQYWEVEVKDKPEWILGVCNESLLRRKKNQNQPFLVKEGLWGIGRYSHTSYIAFGAKKINLLPKVIPTKIGIFLDTEMGEVSFYNLNDRSLLCTFNDYFGEALWPYFYTGTESRPLRICTITDSE